MKFNRRHLAIAAMVVGVTAAVGVARLTMRPARMVAPQVRYHLLDGQILSTQSLTGQVVWVNFWATSCTTCVAEMPQITATFERFRSQGFTTIAVAMQYDAPANVASFAESHRLPFGVAIDNTGAIAHGFGDVALTPTSFLINKQGQIVERYQGAPDFAALQRRIAQLLAQA